MTATVLHPHFLQVRGRISPSGVYLRQVTSPIQKHTLLVRIRDGSGNEFDEGTSIEVRWAATVRFGMGGFHRFDRAWTLNSWEWCDGNWNTGAEMR